MLPLYHRSVSREFEAEYKVVGQHQPQVLCYCCYRKVGKGEARYLCYCTHGRVALCGFLWLVMLFIGTEVGVGLYAGREFIMKHANLEQNLTSCRLTDEQRRSGETFCGVAPGRPRWTPSNVTYSARFPACTSMDLVHEMRKFNSRHSWKLVTLTSRPGSAGQETVELDAWWLPVSNAAAPRIAVVHGNNANFNDWSVQLVAYMLRSMGFAVLLPNLRDHGSAQKTSTAGKTTWGWAYHLDVLGAWDYLVHDPTGELGGALPPSQVGIMGFALGGFAAAAAMALEPDIPGVWLDSAFSDPARIMQLDLQKLLGRFAPYFFWSSWFFANKLARVDLGHMTPAKALSKRLQAQPAMGTVEPSTIARTGTGQPDSTSAVVTAMPNMSSAATSSYNCTVGTSNRDRAWSLQKKAWCCKHHMVGCQNRQLVHPSALVATTTRDPYNCASGPIAWENWTIGKRAWCCVHKEVGCQKPQVENVTTMANGGFTHMPTTATAQHEGNDGQRSGSGLGEGDGDAHGSSTSRTTAAMIDIRHDVAAQAASVPYNCTSWSSRPLRGSLAFEKKRWCCTYHNISCSPDLLAGFSAKGTTTTATVAFDCQAGRSSFEDAWSSAKKAWCCATENLGCPTKRLVTVSVTTTKATAGSATATTPPPYDCSTSAASWERDWSSAKKAWCCKHKAVACKTTQASLDCADTSSWSAKKQDYCCRQHINCTKHKRGLSLTTTTSAPYNCEVSVSFWSNGWSPAKKSWCCGNRGVGCLRKLAESPSPERELSRPLTKRGRCQVAAVAGRRDTVVPASETSELALVIRAGATGFELRETLQYDAVCGDMDHHVWAVTQPQQYRGKLCDFWSAAFGRPTANCGVSRLPHFTSEVGARPGYVRAPAWPTFG
mmetsp:Transcript_118679/g.383217  ORF Transcript_118679/g.383217 Transcript_118679/m.383217 type:complete len:886 (-) Transcript_118679:113-2770(-)